ncbi:hypothetical protein Hanom_Chr13g01196301 [Helianthus anomalus]
MAFEMFTGLNFTLPKPSTAVVDCFRLDMFSGLVNSNFTIQNPSSSMEEIWYAAAPVALLVFTCFVYLISFNKKKTGTLQRTIKKTRLFYVDVFAWFDKGC